LSRTYCLKEVMWSWFHSKTISRFFLVVLVVLGLNSLGYGADWSVSPAVSLTQEYNDNILFSRHDEQDDFIAKLKPSIEIIGQTEQTQFKLNSSVTGEKYFDHSNLDTLITDNTASLRHYWNEKLSTTLSANFRKDNVLETEIERAGLTGVRKDRYRYGFDLSGTYAFSDTLSLTLGGGGSFSEYPNGPYPDLDLWQVSVNPMWAISPKDTLGLLVNYYDADYKDVGTIRTLVQSLYWRRDLTEKTYIVLGAGYRRTRTKYKVSTLSIIIDPGTGALIITPVEKDETSTDSGFIFNFSLNYKWTERFSTTVNAGREQYNSVDARSIERSFIRGTLRYRLTEKASVNCNMGYDITNEEGRLGEDTDYVRVAPYLSYRYTEKLTFRLGGSYEYKKNETDTYSYSRNRFRSWFTVTYQWPRLLASH